MDPAIIKRIVQEVSLPESSVAASLALFEAGATAPFIVRYRKEATGGMGAADLRTIQERMVYYRELEERRVQLLKSLAEQGKLTEDLRQQIDGCWDKTAIEDLHHRFRPKRRTRSSEAIDKGLEPLAEYIWSQDPDAWSLEEHVDVFIDPEKGVADRQQALQGASEIIADWISENLELRKALRELLWQEGFVVSTVVPAKAEQKTKYNMYYDRREPVASIPSHRVLAIRRGTKEGILTSSIQCDSAKALQLITDLITRDRESAFAPVLEVAARDSYSRILRPLIETEVRAQLKERADGEAIRVFQENLENLLQSPPGGAIPVIGVDAGKTDECRLAAVDQQGKFLEEAVVYPRPPKSDIEGTKTAILDLIRKHNISAVAIGSGPSARETEKILRQILADEKMDNIVVATVNDAGVVVYSSSRIGREEFPELPIAARSAVSIARRLQDPLAELVKIDPKLIGVGQYQHDVDQKELHRRLVQTVQFCVNRVGADLNAASFSLLRYISGISDRMARRIVTCRGSNGPFGTRTTLLSVPGLDEATYQQASGFLRIPNSEVPLDRSWIHPESYPIVERMAASLNVGVADLIGNRDLIASLKFEELVDEKAGMPTLEFIREELLAPGKDPRGIFAPPRFRAEVRDIADLKEGMTLEGSVTNVTNFGAFVDIGIHQDGLVHLSQMSNRFIRDPREAVKVGDLVQVKVISIEVETKRIGLSMKALLPAIPRRRKKPRRRPQHSQAAPAASAAASGSAEAAEGAPVENPSAETIPSLPVNRAPAYQRARRRNDPPGRRRDAPPRRNDVAPGGPVPPPPVPEPDPEPKGPEPTLQEKIAILQSKFKGIN
ncbi:MAG: RNA-binding transcriptional accessory protein [Acidobacteriia bacterium]|nr:RNA-binding transcriptional accessory protein [Terriglobia bacterium]